MACGDWRYIDGEKILWQSTPYNEELAMRLGEWLPREGAVILELGVNVGRFTRYVCDRFSERITRYYAVDIWERADVLCEFFRRCASEIRNGVIIPLRGETSFYAGALRHVGERFDIILIDAAHTYENVLEDLRNYMPLLRGVLICDDYNVKCVRCAIDDYFRGKRGMYRMYRFIDNAKNAYYVYFSDADRFRGFRLSR